MTVDPRDAMAIVMDELHVEMVTDETTADEVSGSAMTGASEMPSWGSPAPCECNDMAALAAQGGESFD